MEPEDWTALDRKLSEQANRIRGRHGGVEGGYYVPSRAEQPFLPALPNEPREVDATKGQRPPAFTPLLGRRNLYYSADTPVDPAYRQRNALAVVQNGPP